MKILNNTRVTGVLNTVASLLLFLMFTVCMLVVIGAGAGIYSRINKSYETTYGSAAAIRYVSNKIKASDSCEIIENGKGIVFENDNLMFIIYEGTDGIYEKNLPVGSEIITDGGNVVVENTGMTVSDNGDLYEISVNCSGDNIKMFVRKG